MNGRRLTSRLLASFLAVSLAIGGGAALAETKDPWEGLNRRTFAANDFFDRILLRPVARGYVKVVPRFARQGVRNALANVATPLVAVNQLLQGKGVKAASDTGRFLINTTLGLGGLFDPATRFGLKAHNEDFGQTLQVWGLGTGPYLVAPLLGPTTVTDAIGSILGGFASPIRLVNDTQSQIIIRVVSVVDLRAGLLSAESLLSGDKYLFLRDATLQRRAFLVKDGKVDEDPFLNDEDDEDYADEDYWGVEDGEADVRAVE